ncbi:tripartite motif-containing protein 44 [Polypterus senegalus]|uniref:tripartite motif-containing protein 44 n=1 Tax=Polypterus senegalus TaxID=55291 RepID=UPI0019666F70|nr:tripartite motif-containing protein 44 [Polypterus senegalus]
MATGASGHPGGSFNKDMTLEQDLPSDGTCDACDPDDPQSAVKFCAKCSFAFCEEHGRQHQTRSLHDLVDYGAGMRPSVRAMEQAEGSLQEGVLGASCSPEMDDAQAGGPHQAESEDGHEQAGASRVRNTATVERLRCQEHGQEGTLYCKPDEKIICVLCAVQGSHRDHQIITLPEAFAAFRAKEAIDLQRATREMADRIKTKWTDPNIRADALEAFVHEQFDELHRLVLLEQRRALHLVDLKEAVATAHAAEKMAEINSETEKLKEEMEEINKQLSALYQNAEPPQEGAVQKPRQEPSEDPPMDREDGNLGAAP